MEREGNLRDRAILRLLWSEPEIAARELRELASASEDPVQWSDLSAAYLAQSEDDARPLALYLALDAAEKALAHDPKFRPAQFNKAVALELMGLTQEAYDIWKALTETDAPEWRAEANKRADALISSKGLYDGFLDLDEVHQRVMAIGRDDLAGYVHSLSINWNLYVEDHLIGRWADAILADSEDSAGKFVERAVWILDALDAIDIASPEHRALTAWMRRTPDTIDRLGFARALSEYRAARLDFAAFRMDEAEARLYNANEFLQRIESPFASIVTVRLAMTRNQDGDFANALDLAEAAAGQGARLSKSTRGAALHHKARALLGVGQTTKALSLMRDSREVLLAARDIDQAVSLSTLMSQTSDLLGSFDASWRYRRFGLRQEHEFVSPRRAHIARRQTARALQRDGLQLAALVLQRSERLILESTGANNPVSMMIALMYEAGTLGDLGRRELAFDWLDQAAALSSRIDDRRVREQMEALLQRSTAEVMMAYDSGESIDALKSSISGFERRGSAMVVPPLRLQLARAYRRLGEWANAQQELDLAIREVEARSSGFESSHRVSYLEARDALYEERIYVDMLSGDTESAFDHSTRRRARALRENDVRWSSPGSTLPVSSRLPPSTAMIQYEVLEEFSIVWVLTRDGVLSHRLSLGRESVNSLVDEFRRAVAASLEGRMNDHLRRLFDLLVAPIFDGPSPPGRWFIVPDEALFYVPFAFLSNSETSRRLAEDFTISYSHGRPAEWNNVEPDAFQSIAFFSPNDTGVSQTSAGTLAPVRFDSNDVARYYGTTRMAANEQSTLRDLESARGGESVLHYFGHAIINPVFPEQSRLVLPHGDITAASIAELELNYDLVVLAGCSTAVGPVANGEGVHSLSRAFLRGGARTVLGTLWDVEATTTHQFLTSFHEHLTFLGDPAAALRTTQKNALDLQSGIPLSTSAAFVLLNR